MTFVPTILKYLLNQELQILLSNRKNEIENIICGGEPLSSDLVKQFYSSLSVVRNSKFI